MTGAVESQAAAQRTDAIRDSAIVLGAILLALLLVILVARSLVRPLRTLRDSALRVAHDDLAREIERVRAGKEPGPVEPIPVHTTEEVGQVAHAVDELHEQAILLAGEQSRLQLQVERHVRDAVAAQPRRWSTSSSRSSTGSSATRRTPNGWRACSGSITWPPGCAATAPTCWCSRARRCRASRPSRCRSSALINAAASEVEDYTRVVTATVPDSEIVGPIAGDLVHLLAELLDNALRYSPPISQVRVSAVHTGNGGLVIEVSDIGLGMTESDLRVANTRLQSGGEVTPTPRGTWVCSWSAGSPQQHGLVVRLRSTIAGEPNSGTTAGVYVPSELLVARRGMRDQFDTGPRRHTRRCRTSGIATALALRRGPTTTPTTTIEAGRRISSTGTPRCPSRLLPQRNPGASGISDIPTSLAQPAPEQPEEEWTVEESWPDGLDAGADCRARAVGGSRSRRAARRRPAPVDTSAFFASRAQAASNGVPPRRRPKPQSQAPGSPSRRMWPSSRIPSLPGSRGRASPTAGADDAIYQRMLSEWLVDPTDLAKSSDLNWESVWDHGWSAAEAAEDAPVESTPRRGCRCASPAPAWCPVRRFRRHVTAANGGCHFNGGAHRSHDGDDEVDRRPNSVPAAHAIPVRDPEAVRASMSSHFGGVHAARSHAQETRGTDNE